MGCPSSAGGASPSPTAQTGIAASPSSCSCEPLRTPGTSPRRDSKVPESAENPDPLSKVGVFGFSADYWAFFARSHRAVKAAGSWIAVSESILRFISIPASFRPCMNLE